MIAGENSQTAGVERQRIVHAELGTEICDGRLLRDVRLQLELRPRTRITHIRAESLVKFLDASRVIGIGGHLAKTQIRHLVQQQARVLLALSPESEIQI